MPNNGTLTVRCTFRYTNIQQHQSSICCQCRTSQNTASKKSLEGVPATAAPPPLALRDIFMSNNTPNVLTILRLGPSSKQCKLKRRIVLVRYRQPSLNFFLSWRLQDCTRSFKGVLTVPLTCEFPGDVHCQNTLGSAKTRQENSTRYCHFWLQCRARGNRLRTSTTFDVQPMSWINQP